MFGFLWSLAKPLLRTMVYAVVAFVAGTTAVRVVFDRRIMERM